MIEELAEHNRCSIRLPGYDYSRAGDYYLTMVTFQRECLFGEIRDGEMHLSGFGKIVWEVWNSLPARYPQIILNAAVVMPNHFHAILTIDDFAVVVGAIHELPLRGPSPQHELPQRETADSDVNGIQREDNEFSQRDLSPQNIADEPDILNKIQRRKMLLPKVVGYLKMNSAKRINLIRHSEGNPVWQRNYYEHIIDSEKEYLSIEAYIENNPANWANDAEAI